LILIGLAIRSHAKLTHRLRFRKNKEPGQMARTLL